MSGAKLFMIPWLMIVVESQRTPTATPLGADLLMESHHRHFYEMLRRQQQINDAILLNNALLHQQLRIPASPHPEMIIPQHNAGFFNPFVPPNAQNLKEESTSKLGNYGKEESEVIEKDGTIELPQRDEKTVLAGVKTVSIQRKSLEKEKNSTLVVDNQSTTAVPFTDVQSKLIDEDMEVVQLFKKLNLSKAETKSIVEHVEQIVREEVSRKLKETEKEKRIITTPSDSLVSGITTSTPRTTEIPSTFITTIPTTRYSKSPLTSSTPILRIRNNEEELVIQKNNLKHHPKKKPHLTIQSPTSSSEEITTESSQGSIKTSLTHLPIVEPSTTDEESDSNLHHRRVLIASKREESDRDLLVDFATGAPLDLSDQGLLSRRDSSLPIVREVSTTTAEKLEKDAVYSTKSPSTLPSRQPHHELTNFERLATDYRNRLENTDDINKILQKISQNAYISLVEQNGRRKMFRP